MPEREARHSGFVGNGANGKSGRGAESACGTDWTGGFQENSKPKEHETRPGGVTSGQQKKIWFLMYELKKCDEVPNDVQLGDRLCAVIKKEFGADAVARNPFAWITFEQGNNLIEILKRYVASARKRGEA